MKITSTKLMRTSENHVDVNYFTDNNKSFTIQWSNIHAGTGEIMSSYDYDPQVTSEDETLAEIAANALNMGEDSVLYCDIRESVTNDEIRSHCVVENVCIADFDESESIYAATITVEYSTGDKVHVQLTGGEYKSGLGCLIFLNDEEFGIDECEQNNFIVDNAPQFAEKFIQEKSQNLYEFTSLPFNVSMNNTSYYLRVNNETLAAQIVTENHYNDEYSANHQVLKDYESEDEAWEEINSYRTDEHHDFRGLNALLIAIDPTI